MLGYYLLVVILSSFTSIASAQVVNSMSEGEAIHETMKPAIFSNAYCACPYSLDNTGHACGSASIWSMAPPNSRPRCYPDDVSDSEIMAHQAGHVSGNPHHNGYVSSVIPHPESSGDVTIRGIHYNKTSFIFNGILYYPVSHEVCPKIVAGSYLSAVHVSPVHHQEGSASGVLFKLPDGTGCLARAVGPASL